MDDIKRYTLYTHGVFPSRSGGLVKYEDHKKAVEEAYKRGVEAGIKQEKDAAEYWSRH